jgi:hypothetical protein
MLVCELSLTKFVGFGSLCHGEELCLPLPAPQCTYTYNQLRKK